MVNATIDKRESFRSCLVDRYEGKYFDKKILIFLANKSNKYKVNKLMHKHFNVHFFSI